MKKIKLNDIRLNKKGTIGTEPVGKIKGGKLVKGTDVKLGKLGSVFIKGKKKK